MAVNTWAGGDSGNETDWNTAANWSGGVPDDTDDVVIPNVTHDPVIGSGLNPTINSLKIENGGNLNGNGNTITIDDKDGSSYSFTVISGGIITGTLNIKVTGNGGYISEQGTGSINNLEVDLGSSSDVHYLDADLSIAGNLTITEGIFNTNASSNRTLTVTGKTIVGDGSSAANTAKLTCNASTVSLGASYTADYALRVKRGGTFEGGSGQHTFGSLSTEDHADSITTLTTHTNGTTLSSEYSSAGANGYALAVYDDSTFDDADGLVVYTGPSADSYLSGKTLHNVTINTAGNTIGMQNAHTFNGNLTITAGTLNTRPASTTENNALTVTGTTTIGDGSASATEATLTCNASDIILGSGKTDGYAVIIEVGGFFDGGTGTHTMGSFKIGADNALAKATLTTGVTNINGKSNDSNKAFRIAGSSATFSHPTNGTILMNYSGASSIQTSTKSLYNFTINHASCDVTLVDALTVANNLIITAGELDTTSSDYALTVTGTTTLGPDSGSADQATLTCNASDISLGASQTSSYALSVTQGGTFTGGSGAHTIGSLEVINNAAAKCTLTSGVTTLSSEKTSANRAMSIAGTDATFDDGNGTVKLTNPASTVLKTNFNDLYNLIIDHATVVGKYTDNFVVANDLTINQGTFEADAGDETLTVTGDVTVGDGTGSANTAVLGRSGDDTANNTFGSLTIASDGEYQATSGTTTITGTSNADWNWTNNGTFTHNNGKVKFFTDSTSMEMWISNGDTFYDLEIDSADPSGVYYHNNIIYGDLTVTDGPFHAYTTSTTLTVYGNTLIKSEGQLINGAAQSGTVTFHGLVTNEGILHTGSGTNNFNNGVRNLATMASDDTLTIGGTGGILEGNLDDANVNVNLESALSFDGNDDKIEASASPRALVGNSNDFTISAWVKPTVGTISGTPYIVGAMESGAERFYLRIHDSQVKWGYGDTAGSAAGAVTAGVWTHIALQYDVSATQMKVFINGQLTNTTTIAGKDITNTDNLFIGALNSNGSGANYFTGAIADVKIYNAEVSDADIAILASKIRQDPAVTSAGTTNLKLWYKLGGTETTGSGNVPDDSPQSNTGTLTGASKVYDAFSVNVQDSYDGSDAATRTQTNGNFTVTQGKVEGLALSAAHFTGATNNYVGSTLTSDQKSTREQTFSCWFNADDVTDRGIAGRWTGASQASETSLYLNGSSKLVMQMNSTDSDGSGTYSNQTVTGSTTISADKWYHVVCVASSVGDDNFLKIYVNGVLDGTNSSYGKYIQSANSQFRWGWGYSGGTSEFDGHIRDVRIYAGRALTADQVSSLYSNTLPTTSDCWMKVDAGSGTDAAAFGQSGLYTATSVSPNNVDSTWLNGTLNLDGSDYALIVEDTGTLSAPRGSLLIAGDFRFEDGANFSHNNGEVEFDGADPYIKMIHTPSGRATPTNPLKFYKLKASTTTNYLNVAMDFTVENTWTITNDGTYGVAVRQPAYITMGTSTAAGTITGPTSGQGNIYFATAANGCKVLAADTSGLNPWVYTGNDWGWSATNGHTILLENGDYRTALVTDEGYHNQTTGTNNITIQLTGDMEFDDVTVSSGDTLDLNGQRMECSGHFDNDGTTNYGGAGAMLIASQFSIGGVSDEEAGANLIITGQGSANTDQSFGDGDFVGDATSNIFVNNGSTQLDWTESGYWAGNIIVGSSFRSQHNTANKCNNLTIATGGTLDATDDTLTVAGDFTTSGGLLGASAITLDGGDTGSKRVDCNATVLNGATTFTIEAWIKPDVNNVSFQTLVCARDGGNDGVALSMLNQTIRLRIGDGSSDDLVSGNVITTAGKWYHIAALRDSSNNTKMYIDGKLVKEGTSSKTINISQDLKIGVQSYNSQAAFDGSIDEVRIWNDERTPTEIRANMFSEITSVGSDLILYAKFNEGTGNPVDSGTNTRTLTATGDIWAGAGTFTMGTSTLDFTGDGEWAISDTTTDYYNVKVAASGKTTTINSVGSSERRPRINNLLTHGGGTLTDINNADITFYGTGSHTAGADLSNLYITYWPSSTDIPGGTYQYLITQHNDLSCTANINCGGYFAVSSNDGFDLKTHTLTTGRMILYANSTFNMDAGSLIFDSTSGLTGDYAGRTFTAGPGATISGVAAKSGFFSENNYQIVGDISNLEVTNEELTVVGTVTNCTGDILQFTPGHDTTLSLETDTAEDRDIRLGGPSLDNANHLIAE